MNRHGTGELMMLNDRQRADRDMTARNAFDPIAATGTRE